MDRNRESENRMTPDPKDRPLAKKERGLEPEANKMGTQPVGRLLASMSWPAILSMMILALYNIVDSIFVAQVSSHALTAVSLVNPVQMLMVAISIGSAVGVNSLIARRLGAHRYEEANQAASASVRIGFWNFVLWAVLGIAFARPFMALYTDNQEVLTYGVQYLQIITVLSVFTMVDVQIEKVLQATGNMVAPMIISISGALTNLILDPILIFGMFGLPRMEVRGAAFATIIGQAVALSVALFIFFRKKQLVTIRIRGYKRDWKVIRDIYAVGLPGIVMQSIGSVMLFGFNAIIAASAAAVAVLGVYFKLQMFVFMPVFGLNQGAMPIMGFNYGARNKERLMETFRKGFISAFIIMACGLVLFQTCPEMLLKMFDADAEMMKIGVPALRIMSICFLPASFGIMCSTLFQSTGHGMYSLFASLLRQLVGILPMAYILYHAFGLEACWASFPLAEIIGTIYAIIMLIYLYKTDLKNL